MDIYFNNLLPRLQAYGQKLDKIESFVDKTWAKYDENSSSFQTYRFLRNGKLLITNSGLVNEFSWKYLAPNSLYVKNENFNGHDGIMYRHGFLLDALLVMFIEGNELKPVIFYNESTIPNGNVPEYLRRLFIKKNNLKNTNTRGKYFYTNEVGSDIIIGSTVFNNNLEPINDSIIDVNDRSYTIQKNKVTAVSTTFSLKSSLGNIRIISPGFQVAINSKVISEEGKTLEGKIKIINHETISSIKVKNGVIVRIYLVGGWVNQGLVVLAIIIIAFIFYTWSIQSNK